MTRYIWTRVFIASLFFLGDLAYATENRLRVETEATTSDITIQLSKQTVLDDSETSLEPAVIGVNTLLPAVYTINRQLALVAYTEPGKLKYSPLHPRAPPQAATR